VARSIGRTHRLVRFAAIGAALATVALAGGCSAGQLAATSQVVPAVPGGFATATPDPANPLSVVLVQNATIIYNGPLGYPAGGTAPVSLTIFNQTKFPLTVAPGGVAFKNPNDVANSGTLKWISAAAAAAPSPSPSPSPSTSPTPAPKTSPSTSPSDSASPGDSGSPSAAPTPTEAPTLPPITIAPAGYANLSPAQEQYFGITDLAARLTPGTIAYVTLAFTDNGKLFTATVATTFASPTSPAARESESP
jgi:hypothetical protein